jgi:hypothetical protein
MTLMIRGRIVSGHNGCPDPCQAEVRGASLLPTSSGRKGLEVGSRTLPQMLEDVAAVGDAAPILDNERELAARRTEGQRGDRPVGDAGKPEICFDLEAERTQIHPPGWRELMQLDQRRVHGPRA